MKNNITSKFVVKLFLIFIFCNVFSDNYLFCQRLRQSVVLTNGKGLAYNYAFIDSNFFAIDSFKYESSIGYFQTVYQEGISNRLALFSNGITLHNNISDTIIYFDIKNKNTELDSFIGGEERNQIVFLRHNNKPDHVLILVPIFIKENCQTRVINEFKLYDYKFTRPISLNLADKIKTEPAILIEVFLNVKDSSYWILTQNLIKDWTIYKVTNEIEEYKKIHLEESCTDNIIWARSTDGSYLAKAELGCKLSLFSFNSCHGDLDLLGECKLPMTSFPEGDILFSNNNQYLYLTQGQKQLLKIRLKDIGNISNPVNIINLDVGSTIANLIGINDSLILGIQPFINNKAHKIIHNDKGETLINYNYFTLPHKFYRNKVFYVNQYPFEVNNDCVSENENIVKTKSDYNIILKNNGFLSLDSAYEGYLNIYDLLGRDIFHAHITKGQNDFTVKFICMNQLYIININSDKFRTGFLISPN